MLFCFHDTEAYRIAHQSAINTASQQGDKGVLGIDFDDTITADAVAGVAAMVELRRRGYGLVVFTANADLEGIESWLHERWPVDAGLPPPVTDRKPQARTYIDDKGYKFIDWALVLTNFV